MTKLKLLVLGILVLIVGWLAYLNIKPTRAYKEDFSGLQSLISEAKDVTGVKVLPQKIEGFSKEMLVMEKDRLYFNLSLNDVFVGARFKIKFRNEKQLEFNLRVPVHEGVKDAVKYHLEEKRLDALKIDPEWIAMQNDSTILFLQKKNIEYFYNSLEDFLNNLPVTKGNKGTVVEFGDYTFPPNADLSKTQVVSSERADVDKDFDYVIARYEQWKNNGDWKYNQYKVVIPEAFRRKNVSFPFYLEAPGLEMNKNKIIIDSIEITLEKPSIMYVDKIYNSKTVKIK